MAFFFMQFTPIQVVDPVAADRVEEAVAPLAGRTSSCAPITLQAMPSQQIGPGGATSVLVAEYSPASRPVSPDVNLWPTAGVRATASVSSTRSASGSGRSNSASVK